MPGPHEGVSTQCTNQQVLAKPQHQPSERDQQAREKLRQKAKIKSHAYIQLGEKVLQTVHQTFAPDIPVILHLPALVNSTIDTDTPTMLYIIQEGINCMPTTDYFFTSIKPAQSDYLSDSKSSEDEVNPHLCTSQEERVYGTIKGSTQATQAVLSHTTAQCNPTVERGPPKQPKIKKLSTEQAVDKTTQTKEKEKPL